MAKGPKGFSDEEKAQLKLELMAECEQIWATRGYKKTAVSELTKKVGISTGAFYLLYPAKEDLFCDTLQNIQHRLKSKMEEIVLQQRGKEGFVNAIIWHFDELIRLPYLHETSTDDFISFASKLPLQKVEALKFDNKRFFYSFMESSGLKPKIEEEKIFAVINSLLSSVVIDSPLNREAFEFLLNTAVDNMFF